MSLRLGEIDLDLKPIQRSLYLCRPDKTTILSLKDINGLKYNMKLGVVDELSFTIPTQVERDHQIINNPLIEKIKHRYLFKLIYNHQTQYFIFNERNKEYGENETISYRGYSQGYQLADKDIRDYEAVSKSLTEILYDVLSTSKWKVGYVDSDFDTKIRSHEISSSTTLLQAVYDLAEKFNAVTIFDSEELTVNMYSPSRIGMDKGLRLKEGKYLESFSLTDNSEEVVSRLKVYGQNGLTIRKLTPTGANYLEDFSWYLYPFRRDSQGNVLDSSDYMSDSLAIALEDYNTHLASLQGQFDTLLNQLLDKQDEIQIEGQRLSVLLADLVRILDERDIYNSTGSGNISDIRNRLNSKESEINTCESKINSLIAQETAIEDDIDDLRVQTSIENHLSGTQLLELDDFIVIKEYTNDIIVDEQDLLKEGIEAFNNFREPTIGLRMNIVNFLSNLESQNDHDKLGLGDTVTVRNSRLQVDIKAKIIEIEFDFDNDDITLNIANERDIKDSDARFLDMIYSSHNTSNTVNMNKFKWGLIEDTNSMVSQILNEAWDTAKRSITAGYQQNITINERGIIIKSPEDPMKWIIIQNGLIALTNDSGDSWRTAITPDGIYAEQLAGRIILSNRLLIEDENGIIKIDGSSQTIYDVSGNEKVILGKFDDDNYGLKISSGAIHIEGGLTRNNISQEYTDSVVYDDSGIRGDLRLTSRLPNSITLNSNGITATTSNSSNFARLDSRGLYVQGGAIDIRTSASSNRGVLFNANGISGYNSAGARTFHLDTNGNLNATTGTFSGSLSSATGSFSGTLNAVSGTFTTLSSGTISGATISGGTINGSNINTEYSIDVGRNITMRADFGQSSGIYFQTPDAIANAYIIKSISELSFSNSEGYIEFLTPTRFSNAEFNGNTYVHGELKSYGNVDFSGIYVDFRNASVNGLSISASDVSGLSSASVNYANSAGSASNSTRFGGYVPSDFSMSGHVHNNYLTTTSTSYIRSYSNQTIELYVDRNNSRLVVYNGSWSRYVDLT